MIEVDKPNPFAVLQVPVDAPRRDVVERHQSLEDEAGSPQRQLLLKWACEQLTRHPFTRLEYELFEMPGAAYEDADWTRFARENKRHPVDLAKLKAGASPPGIDDFHLPGILRLAITGLLVAPEVDLRDIVDTIPMEPNCGPPPLEVRDVIFG